MPCLRQANKRVLQDIVGILACSQAESQIVMKPVGAAIVEFGKRYLFASSQSLPQFLHHLSSYSLPHRIRQSASQDLLLKFWF